MSARETPAAHVSVSNPFTPEEVEFQAEDELVSVVPRFKHDPFHFISGTFGPFVPNTAVEVPLWFAVTLRKRSRCTIAPPEWLELQALTQVLEEEQSNTEAFQPLPYHYIEVASLLFECAADDIPEADRVRTILEDIQNVRMAKVRKGVQELAELVNKDEQRIKSVNLTHIAAMEVFQIRPFLTSALNRWYSMAIMPSEDTSAARRRPQGRSRFSGVSSAPRTPTATPPSTAEAEADTGGAADADGPPLPSSQKKARRLR